MTVTGRATCHPGRALDVHRWMRSAPVLTSWWRPTPCSRRLCRSRLAPRPSCPDRVPSCYPESTASCRWETSWRSEPAGCDRLLLLRLPGWGWRWKWLRGPSFLFCTSKVLLMKVINLENPWQVLGCSLLFLFVFVLLLISQRINKTLTESTLPSF